MLWRFNATRIKVRRTAAPLAPLIALAALAEGCAMSTTPPEKHSEAAPSAMQTGPSVVPSSPGANTMPPPRDYEVGIQEEFDLAAKADTVESWTLFIDRHPGHALVERARQRLTAARAKPSR